MHSNTWTRDLLTPGRFPTADAALIICGVWFLWSGRNARKHGKENWNPRAAFRHVSAMLEDLVCSTAAQEVSMPTSRSRWSRPPEGWLKINTAAATTSGASGVVIRNFQSEVLAAAARAYTKIARDGVLLATEQGATKVILEVDNLSVANLI